MLKDNVCSFDSAAPLMTIISKFERVSDQAKNICNETLYMCTGEMTKHPGAEAFRILFIDDNNSCQSQIAEAIALSFKEKKFIFSSAGIEPKPIDRSTIEFMKTKGIDLTRMPRKESPDTNLDHYQVIIALIPNVSKVLPNLQQRGITGVAGRNNK
jgi:hypothetical protein